jgi:hypothetical protein
MAVEEEGGGVPAMRVRLWRRLSEMEWMMSSQSSQRMLAQGPHRKTASSSQ